jgi:hypothetical protein
MGRDQFVIAPSSTTQILSRPNPIASLTDELRPVRYASSIHRTKPQTVSMWRAMHSKAQDRSLGNRDAESVQRMYSPFRGAKLRVRAQSG